jgi:hypothetical protein
VRIGNLRKSAGCRREERDLGDGFIVENLKRGQCCQQEQAGVAGVMFMFVGCLSWFSVNVRKSGEHQAAAGIARGLLWWGVAWRAILRRSRAVLGFGAT